MRLFICVVMTALSVACSDPPAVCTPGSTRSCLMGLPGTSSEGTQTCDSKGRGFDPCSSRPSDPVAHERIGTQIAVCTPLSIRSCLSGERGVCAAGVQQCASDGVRWGQCRPETTGNSEVCDGVDNDCDGTVDDGLDCR